METRLAAAKLPPQANEAILKLHRKKDGAYTSSLSDGPKDVLVEMLPDGRWDIYTAGAPYQLGLWRDASSHETVPRKGILGWLGFTKDEEKPANGAIEVSEVRPLDFLEDDATNRERYREVNLPPATQVKPWKAKHYEVSMDIKANGAIESKARIQGIATTNTPYLPLDFSHFSSEVQVNSPQGPINSVTITDAGLLIEHPLDRLQEFDLEVAYRGQPRPVSHPAVPADLGWLTKDASTITFNGVDRASSWLPGDDDPSNKATYDFKVTVPKGHFAIANGELISEQETEGGTEFHYTSKYPMASYLVSVNTFDSKKYAKTEVAPGFEVVHPKAIEGQIRSEFANHAKMMSFLSQRLGPYPFESYGAIVADIDTDTYASRFTDGKTTIEAELGYQVAFEAQTRPIYPTSAIKGHGGFEDTLIHELAHQWFGNCVTKASEQDIWVNEAFPSYTGALWREANYGPEALESEMQALYTHLKDHKYKDTMACPDRDKLFSLENYGRMTLSMHALRKTLGDEQFYKTLAGIIKEHKYTSITVEQMIETANRLNDGKLSDFFNSWLYSTTLPALPKD